MMGKQRRRAGAQLSHEEYQSAGNTAPLLERRLTHVTPRELFEPSAAGPAESDFTAARLILLLATSEQSKYISAGTGTREKNVPGRWNRRAGVESEV